ncbi:MAG: helix-turn-helix transcriptional regulator [Blautia sp.]|nr:helix-turn-helix transcriptional regulator [Blautia sp.]
MERTGISASTFTRMKHHYPISMTVLTRIADVLQCSENDLFERM